MSAPHSPQFLDDAMLPLYSVFVINDEPASSDLEGNMLFKAAVLMGGAEKLVGCFGLSSESSELSDCESGT